MSERERARERENIYHSQYHKAYSLWCLFIGPLEDNAGNKITQGILMAE